MSKGTSGSKVITALSNAGANSNSYSISLSSDETGYAAGDELVEVYTCTNVTVSLDGSIPVTISSGLPQVFVSASFTGDGLCDSTSTKTTSTTASECATATSLAVLFKETATTTYGENIFLAGSVPRLGSWDPGNAVPLSANEYTSSNHLWYVRVSLPVGERVEYKFIRKESDGEVRWESDPNRVYTVPTGCVGAVETVKSSWR